MRPGGKDRPVAADCRGEERPGARSGAVGQKSSVLFFFSCEGQDHRCPFWLIWLNTRGRFLVYLVQSTTGETHLFSTKKAICAQDTTRRPRCSSRRMRCKSQHLAMGQNPNRTPSEHRELEFGGGSVLFSPAERYGVDGPR